MKDAGYPLGAALALLLTLNVGATAFLALLSVRLPAVLLYPVVFLAGCFVFASQVLVYAYVGRVYPAASRATGLGWAAGVGRIGAICGPLLGGALVSAGIAFPWGFYAFALVGALGAVGVVAVGSANRPATTAASPTAAA
jgi:MFS family permease